MKKGTSGQTIFWNMEVSTRLFSALSVIVCSLLLTISSIAQQTTTLSTFDNTDLTTNINTNVIGSSYSIGPVAQGVDQKVTAHSRRLKVIADMGDIYTMGKLDWSANVNLTFTVFGQNNNILLTAPIDLAIIDDASGKASPEQIVYIDFTGLDQVIDHVDITAATFFSNWTSTPAAANFLRVRVELEDIIGYGVNDGSGSPVIVNNLAVQGLGQSVTDSRFTNVKFSWDLPGTGQKYDSYDLEVLKLEPEGVSGGVPVDWATAARIEVNGCGTEYTLTFAEGTGYYAWRVRPIGSYYVGGRSDRRNYGDYTQVSAISGSLFTGGNFSFPDDYTVVTGSISQMLTSAVQSYDYFYYEQFDNDANFTYSRVLTENSRQKEAMSFANGLNQVHQVQIKLFSQQEVVGAQTVYDYSGRPALRSMKASVEDQYLGYKPSFFAKDTDNDGVTDVLYSAVDFDGNSTIYNPTPFSGTTPLSTPSPGKYYSDEKVGGLKDFYIPQSDNLPFSRTLYNPDATGRVLKEAGVGPNFQLQLSNDPTLNHIITTEYGGVAQVELDRLFGSEAPLYNTAYKIQTTDHNGVKTATYMSKGGDVLATFVNNEGPTPTNLKAIDGGTPTSFSVTDELEKGSINPGSSVSETSTTLIVDGNTDHDANTGTPDEKQVSLFYEITPNTLGVDCDLSCTDCDICWECDYRVEISILCPQFPADDGKNVKLIFNINPNSAFDCASPTPSAITLDDLTSSGNNVQIIGPDGLVSTNADMLNIWPNKYVYLPSGTYSISKKVFVNNVNPDVLNTEGLTFVEQHLEELKAQAESWTASENCCGPITIDASGFICDDLPLSCGSSEMTTLATQLYNDFIDKEQSAMIEDGADPPVLSPYVDELDPAIKAVLGSNTYSGDLTAFIAKINELCTLGISSVDIENCFAVYGGILDMNINYAEQVKKGNTGYNGASLQEQFDDSFDLLASVFTCLGDPFGVTCNAFQMTVDYTVATNSSDEVAAQNIALANQYDRYYIVWHKGLTGGAVLDPNNSTDMGGHYAYSQTSVGQAILIEIPDPANPLVPTDPGFELLNQQKNCVEFYAFPDASPLVPSDITDPVEARAFLAKQQCNCFDGIAAGTASPDPNVLTDIIAECENICSAKELAFEGAVSAYVTNFNSAKSPPIFTDETSNVTPFESIWDPTGSKQWEGFDDLFPGEDIQCFIGAMEEQCISQCQLTFGSQVENYINDAITGLDDQGKTCDNVDDYASPLPGSSALHDCGTEFVQSQEFFDFVQQEQLEFIQAFQWNPEFAPVAPHNAVQPPSSTNSSYSDFGLAEDIRAEIISFFYNRLNFNMTARPGTDLLSTSSATYNEHWLSTFGSGTDYYFTQETFPFNYELVPGSGSAFQAVAVINVIWDPGTFGLPIDLTDDFIHEINISAYCIGGGGVAGAELFHWAYAPDAGCNLYTGINPSGYSVEHQIAELSFDAATSFHAQLISSSCTPGTTDINNVCEADYLASAEIKVLPGGSIGDDIMIEAGIEGDEVNLTDGAILWQSDPASILSDHEYTVLQIVNAINGSLTAPNYTATYTFSAPDYLIHIFAAPNTDTDPVDTDFDIILSGVLSPTDADLIRINTGGSFDFIECDDRFDDLVSSSCSTSVMDTYLATCPYGFFNKPKVYTGLGGFNMPADLIGLETELVDFWDMALTDIINNRTNRSTSSVYCSWCPSIITDHYDRTKDIQVNGKYYTAYVSVGVYFDNELTGNDLESIQVIQVGMHCRDNTANFQIAYVLSNAAGLGQIIYPELGLINGQYVTPNNFVTAIPYFFDDIEFTDFISAPSPLDHMLFDINDANIPASGAPSWTPGFGAVGAVIDYDGVQTAYSPDIESFLLTGFSTCSIPTNCDICMRWVEPKLELPLSANPVEVLTCEGEQEQYIENQIDELLDKCLDEKLAEIIAEYENNCLYDITDEFSITYSLNYGHYTLYYYDRANNLIATIPPEGVNPITGSTDLASIITYRTSGLPADARFPRTDGTHEMVTKFQYNSIKKRTMQETPDGGISKFWHNAAGQLILGQDATQAAASPSQYSYTRYDNLGRIAEVGELVGFSPTITGSPGNEVIGEIWDHPEFPANLPLVAAPGIPHVREVVTTVYTISAGVDYLGAPQQNLRNRVSSVSTDDGFSIYYSYDPHGGVEWVVQELPEIGRKSIRYIYDLVSGKVNQAIYNEGTTEQFFHKYAYNEDGNPVKVLTSTNGLIWDCDATYEYFLHGPMNRMGSGEDKLQGNDYTYTLQGDLKAINQPELDQNGDRDPGRDGAYSAILKIEHQGSNIVVNDVNLGGNFINSMMVNTMNYAFANTVILNGEGPVATATDVVAAINAMYDPSGSPLKASNNGGVSDEVIVYTMDISASDEVKPSGGFVVANMTVNGYIKDEFAMEIGYFDGDFNRSNSFIGGKTGSSNVAHYPFDNTSITTNGATADLNPLYNGNIAYWISNTRSGQTTAGGAGAPYAELKVNLFHYDMLNRIKESDFRYYETSSTAFNNADTRYDASYIYDHNGNLSELLRNGYDDGSGPTSLVMDDFLYHYQSSTNKLTRIEERANALPAGVNGLFNDVSYQLTSPNYVYDEEGNLLEDKAEKIKVEWNLINKVSSVKKFNTTSLITQNEQIDFEYDALGNRVMKRITDVINNKILRTYYYVRDASGSVRAIYKKNYDATSDETTIKLKEMPIFGISRVGSYNPDLELQPPISGYVAEFSPPIVSTFLGTGETIQTFNSTELKHWVASAFPESQCSGGFGSGVIEIDFSSGAPMAGTSTSMSVSTQKNIAIAEDAVGNLQFKFMAVDFLGTEIRVLQNAASSFLLGNHPSFTELKGDFNTSSIVAQAPDNQAIYHTITGDDGTLYYHTVDMGLGLDGEVIGYNQPLTLNTGGNLTYHAGENQYALAVYNNMIDANASKLYVAVNTKANVELYMFEINGTSIAPGVKQKTYSDFSTFCISGGIFNFCLTFPAQSPRVDLGEMQISPQGDELSLNIYRSERHSIEQFNINTATGSISSTPSTIIENEPRPAAANNVRKYLQKTVYSFDYSPDADYLYYMQQQNIYWIFKTVDLKRLELATSSKQFVDGPFWGYTDLFLTPGQHADVRRGIDNSLYLNYFDVFATWAGTVTSELVTFSDLDNATASVVQGTKGDFQLNACYNRFGLPLQPWKSQEISYYAGNGTRNVGSKIYEVSDHLGNVRVTFSDLRVADENGDGTYDDPAIDVTSWSDYYAFGMSVPGRNFTSSNYRYGFQGQEKDDEVKGNNNSYDFGARMYDPRTGRWLSIDPFETYFTSSSPYAFAHNNPVILKDPDGGLPILPLLLKGGAEAAADYFLQVAMNYLFEDDVQTLGQAMDKVDNWQVFGSFLQGMNPFKVPGGKFGAAALVGVSDLVLEYAKATYHGQPYTTEDAMKDFMIGFLSELAADKLGDFLKDKNAWGNLATKLKKLGVDDTFLDGIVVTKWKGPADYKVLDELPRTKVKSGADFTPPQKKKVIDHNKKSNDGVIRSDKDGSILVPSTKHTRGVTPSTVEAQVDHVVPKDAGGSNSIRENAQVLSMEQNRTKSNKVDAPEAPLPKTKRMATPAEAFEVRPSQTITPRDITEVRPNSDL